MKAHLMTFGSLNIRKKLLFSVLALWVVFLLATYVLIHQYVLGNFLELEAYHLKKDMIRIHNSLGLEQTYIQNATLDWSHWDDPYDYVQGKNDKFVDENMNDTPYKSLDVDIISFWDLQHKPIISRMYDPTKTHEIPPPGIMNDFANTISFEKQGPEADSVKGMILSPEYGILIIAGSKVTDALMKQPPKGLLAFARVVNTKFAEKLKKITEIDLNIIAIQHFKNDKNLLNKFNSLLNSRENFMSSAIDNKIISAYSIVRDSKGTPIGIITTKTPRNIYQLGLSTAYTLLGAVALIGLIIVGLLYCFANMIIINRLEKLKTELKDITESKKFTSKVTAQYSDEISYVSNQINHMFDVINETNNFLERRVVERTQALNQTNATLTQEISERRKIENELLDHKQYLTQLAHYDALTGLPNRVLLNEVLNKALIDAQKSEKKVALLFIDLDRFKAINDAKGHETGDFVLKVISKRISNLLTQDELIARIGGDEFIVMMKNVPDKEKIDHLSKAILDVCSQPVSDNLQTYYLSASIGISIYPYNGRTLEELQKHADIAMYRSKTTAPGNYVYFENDMNFEAESSIELDEQLHQAIENEEFSLHYQPKYDIKTGNLKGVEALIRWHSPTLGFVSPSQFVPYAEKSGLIIPIGEWVLHEACRTLVEWRDKGYTDLNMSINLSGVQFNRTDVIDLLSNVISLHGIDPQYFEIEITESAIINDIVGSTAKLQEMRDLGFKISIDDFGTGYTSIKHLKTFPIDFLKIDKIFVDGIPKNPADMAIIQSIVELSHKLGLLVVAEGIETAEQLDYLDSINCDIAQGYFLAKPLTKEDMTSELLKEVSHFGEASSNGKSKKASKGMA